MMIKDYLCLDLETTGLNPKTEKIIEIGAVRVRDGRITDSFESLVAPGRLLEDHSLCKRAAINCKCQFEKRGIDTLKIARKFLPDLESRSLSYLCSYYKIEHRAHRALEDAKATVSLYQKLAEEFYTEEDFRPFPLIYKVKKESPVTTAQKERLYHLFKKHKLAIEADQELRVCLSIELDKMTKNEASRYTDRILSKYGR